jgi:hypothetical protein
MSPQRAQDRKPQVAERSAGVLARAATAHTVHRRPGNRGASTLLGGSGALRVSSPRDAAEHEAASRAARVVRMPAPSAGAARNPTPSSSPQLQRRSRSAAEPQTPEQAPHVSSQVSQEIRQQLSGGQALPAQVRLFMEPRLGADFGSVRIHTDAAAARLSDEVDAHAFTVGNHVFFGSGQFQPDTAVGKELIAHELTHTLQQSEGAAEPQVQRQDKDNAGGVGAFLESVAWELLESVAPKLVPIFRQGPEGILSWLKEHTAAALEAMVDALLAPLRLLGGVDQQLLAHVLPLIEAVQLAVAQIAKNDCTPLRQAAEKIEQTALRLITPVIEKLQPVVAKVKEVLSFLWDSFGAPIWDLLKKYAGQQWDQLMELADALKSAAAAVWNAVTWLGGKVWSWFKGKLGLADGPDGQDGAWQWFKNKVDSLWTSIKTTLEPFKKEIIAVGLTIGGVLLALSPAGPILLLAGAVAGAAEGLRWIYANWGKGNLIIQARTYLEKTLIPSLLGATTKLANAVTNIATSLSNSLGALAAGLSRSANALTGTILRLAVSAVRWLADRAQALATWAQHSMTDASRWVTSAVASLQRFMRRMLTLFAKIGGIILDIWSLPVFLAGEIWESLPACVRDPVVDFLGPLILKQIELFQELGKDPEAWQRTKQDIANIVRLVFKTRDLEGAVRAGFHLLLRVFNIPPELLTSIVQKAQAAWDVVSKKPIDFIKNAVRALGHGFKLLWDNIGDHLKFGLKGWLLGNLQDKKITLPDNWSDPKQLFNLALDVMGLSVEHVYELLKKRFDAGQIDAIRKAIGTATKVIDWVNQSIDTSKSPRENAQGIWDQAKGFGGTVLTGIAEWVLGRIAKELAIMATAAAASAGLSEVVDIVRRIYKAILTAKRWAAQILNMVSKVLDNVNALAAGAVEKVGAVFEGILHLGMPVVIGFLGDQVGLDGVATVLRELIDGLREQVDAALLWFIDKIKAGLMALISLVKAGVKALTDWWNKTVPLKGPDGAHTLKFNGKDRNAALTINSVTKTLPEFVRPFEALDNSKATAAQAKAHEAAIHTLVAKLVAEEAKDKPKQDKALIDKLSDEVRSLVDDIGKLLQALMDKNAPEGSEQKPVQIDYPKRSASAYPIIYIGPRSTQPISQAFLKGLAGKSKVDASSEMAKHLKLPVDDLKKDWDGTVRVLSPTPPSPVKVDGKEVGLSPEFASLAQGKILLYNKKGETGGGGKINDVFRPYGYVPKINGGDGYDGDHVLERQLGGPDALENLWPLPASENRSSGATIKSLTCTFDGQETPVHSARELYAKNYPGPFHLLVRTTR